MELFPSQCSGVLLAPRKDQLSSLPTATRTQCGKPALRHPTLLWLLSLPQVTASIVISFYGTFHLQGGEKKKGGGLETPASLSLPPSPGVTTLGTHMS